VFRECLAIRQKTMPDSSGRKRKVPLLADFKAALPHAGRHAKLSVRAVFTSKRAMGVEPTPKRRISRGKQQKSTPTGSNTGSNVSTDPDLAALIAAWPMLPQPLRRAMLAMIREGGEQ
jgi:hypothetical protein